MYPTPTAWSEGDIATTCKLWAEGYSATQISRQLVVKRTRNAVIGKIHRMGLARRSTPSRPAKRPVQSRRPRIVFIPNAILKPTRMRLCDARLAGLHELEPVCFGDAGPRTILTIREGECRYTAGNGADAKFCGRACVGAWCALHAKLVYQPSRKREREDASIARVTRWLDRKSSAESVAA